MAANVLPDYTGDSVGDGSVVRLDLSVGPIDLGAATYWLQLRENAIGSAGGGDPFTINWMNRFGGSLGFDSRQDHNETNPVTWPTATGGDQAFQLISAVPEPTTVAMIGVAALGGAAASWKRRRQAR